MRLYVECCLTVDADDRKVKLKVEIKPVSPSIMSADNVSDIRSLVKGLHISAATPTVCPSSSTFPCPANV